MSDRGMGFSIRQRPEHSELRSLLVKKFDAFANVHGNSILDDICSFISLQEEVISH